MRAVLLHVVSWDVSFPVREGNNIRFGLLPRFSSLRGKLPTGMQHLFLLLLNEIFSTNVGSFEH